MSLLGQPRNPHFGQFLSAHRGAWGVDPALPQPAPENSIQAIDNAAQLKFEMVELDVKLTADGDELVLMHDYTLGRTTEIGYRIAGDGLWNPFLAETPNGKRPQDEGEWEVVNRYNTLVSELPPAMINDTPLRLFDKSAGTLGTVQGATAKGRWLQSPSYGDVPFLYNALNHIGDRYPGMTVVLDLRHLDEVKAAIQTIDKVRNCEGVPASEWVILKPFANVFKGGWRNAYDLTSETPHPESVEHLIGPTANRYKWIPVVSNRLVPPNPPGQPSAIPNSPGPDPSQIMANAKQYLQDWKRAPDNAVVTFEIGYGPSSPQGMKEAYEWAQSYVTNMQSWRPPDIDVVEPVYDPIRQDTIMGFNWKDDGMGAYPVYRSGMRSYQDTVRTAGALTIEDPTYVLKSETATRRATQMAIVKTPHDFMQFYQYRIINKYSGKALNVAGGGTAPGTNVNIWNDNTSEAQMWRIMPDGQGGYYIRNAESHQALAANSVFTRDGTNVVIENPVDYEVGQRWKLVRNANGTYTIALGSNGLLLDADGASTADGTNVLLWSANGGANQEWYVVPVSTFVLTNVNATKPLDTDGRNVFIHSDHAATAKWRPVGGPEGTFLAMNPYYAKALDVYDSGTANGTTVQIFARHGSPNQRWQLDYRREDDSFSILNPNSGKVLDVAGGHTDDGSPVIIYDDHGGSNQRWRLIEVQH